MIWNFLNEGNKEFRILVCLIEIWDDDGTSALPGRLKSDKITEVESIEISESFTQVINSARIKFPKGTVLRQTITNKTEEPEIKFNSEYMISYVKNGAKIAGSADFSVGRRIAIRLGYTDNPDFVKLSNAKEPYNIYNNDDAYNDYCNGMNYFFSGYITQCSTEEPIEIKCENRGHLLRNTMVQFTGSEDNLTVYDFLADGSRFNLLKDIDLKLHPDVKSKDLYVGKFSPDKPMTLYELLSSWAKKHLYSFIVRDGDIDYLVVARSSHTNVDYDSVNKMAQVGRNRTMLDIDFDIDVANNGLTLSKIDPFSLAVRASGTDKDGKQLRVVVAFNPNMTDPTKNLCRTISQSGQTKKDKKAGKASDKVSLKGFTILDYHSEETLEDMDQLIHYADQYLLDYNKNGMDGTLELFGDYGDYYLYPGSVVHLLDNRHPAKNGKYVVGEVVTRFGVKGYRRIIKLPYCLRLDIG
jgi:hypothetical protein